MSFKNPKTDVILPITQDAMQQIALGHKNHEFRKSSLPASVQRIWFYTTTPCHHIAYIGEIDPVGRTRAPGRLPLLHDGVGNQQWNECHPGWAAYEFAYFIREVYRIREPLALQDLKAKHGIKGPPRGLLYVTESMLRDVRRDGLQQILPRQVVDSWMRMPPRLDVRSSRPSSPAPVDVEMDVPSLGVSRALKRYISESESGLGPRRKRSRFDGEDYFMF